MKKIAVIANNIDYARHIADSLKVYFEDRAEFRCYNTETVGRAGVVEDFVVLSAFTIFQQVKKKVKPDARILIIDLTLSKRTLKELDRIPRNAKALLVNIDYRCCMEVITMIYNCGFKSLELVPYYPGCDYDPSIKTAITPGEQGLVPEGMDVVIDLKQRLIDINSIYRIAQTIGDENPIRSEAAKAAAEQAVNFNPVMDRLLGENSSLSGQINTILKLVRQGILITNFSGKICLANEMAKEMLRERTELLIGFNVAEVFPEFSSVSGGLLSEEQADKLISINDRQVIVKVSRVEEESGITGNVIMLEYFEEAEDRQHRMRSKIRGYGHKAAYTFDQILGESEAIETAKKIAMRMARSESSICLFGESGTGKELFAQSIHNYSSRKDYLFVAINCSALPENLLESELYGYEEGAFSGAKKGGKIGLFELAHKGTLFLDEIGELPMQMQAKLLRAVEERKILKVGGRNMIDVDVRVICATNRNLEKMVEEGSFRQDLYYRLCVLPVHIPPLRSREGDVLLLMNRMKAAIGAEYRLSPEAESRVLHYRWPGNVRELKNVTEYLANLGKPVIDAEDIPVFHGEQGIAIREEKSAASDAGAPLLKVPGDAGLAAFILREIEAAQRNRIHVGRQTLAQRAAEEGVFATEPEIRREMKKLSDAGYIVSFRGRKGSAITERGLAALREWEHK